MVRSVRKMECVSGRLGGRRPPKHQRVGPWAYCIMRL